MKFIISVFLSAMAMCAFADNFSLTPREKSQISEEAENWIDNMPEGLQDRLSDAVEHAKKGFFSEINYIRNLKDTTGVGKYSVITEEIKDFSSPDVSMRLYKAKASHNSKIKPLLIYFHGGGWSVGSIDLADKFCRALAADGNVNVIAVSYPLSPEHPAPAALNSCVKSTEYIYANASSLGSDKSLISIGGDGAGGNLAIKTQQAISDRLKVRSLVLFYPLINNKGNLDPKNKREYGRGYGFDSRVWEEFVDAYNDVSNNAVNSLPPTLLIAAGQDIIIDQEEEFRLAHKEVTYVLMEDALHGFITDGQQKTAFRKAVEFTDLFLQMK